MLVSISLLLSFFGFGCLALAMARHHAQFLGRKLSPGVVRCWQLAGVALLTLSIWPAMSQWPNPAIGLTAWLGIITISAFALGISLSRPTPKRCHLAALSCVISTLSFGIFLHLTG